MQKPFSDGQVFLWLLFEKLSKFFFRGLLTPWKTWKSILDDPPWNPRTLGPCPDDRAQNSVQDSLNESSVRPNPTLFFSKIRFQFWPPPGPPKTATPGMVMLVLKRSPPERREVSVWQGNYWFCNQNGGKGSFPSFQWWPFRYITQDKGQKAGPHILWFHDPVIMMLWSYDPVIVLEPMRGG